MHFISPDSQFSLTLGWVAIARLDATKYAYVYARLISMLSGLIYWKEVAIFSNYGLFKRDIRASQVSTKQLPYLSM